MGLFSGTNKFVTDTRLMNTEKCSLAVLAMAKCFTSDYNQRMIERVNGARCPLDEIRLTADAAAYVCHSVFIPDHANVIDDICGYAGAVYIMDDLNIQDRAIQETMLTLFSVHFNDTMRDISATEPPYSACHNPQYAMAKRVLCQLDEECGTQFSRCASTQFVLTALVSEWVLRTLPILAKNVKPLLRRLP